MTRPLTVMLVLAALLVGAVAADAAPRALRFVDILRPEAGDVTVPPEWDGIWVSTDSTYDCNDVLQSVDTYNDTLCAGQVLSFGQPEGGPIAVESDYSGGCIAGECSF